MRIVEAKPYVKLAYHPKHTINEAIQFVTEGMKVRDFFSDYCETVTVMRRRISV